MRFTNRRPPSRRPERRLAALVAAAGLLAVVGLLAVPLALPVALHAQDEVEQCEGPVGTLAVVEPQDEILRQLQRYGLQSPTTVIRRMVAESGCFIVVERGIAFDRMQQERELARSGELTGDANMGSGQMQAADFYLTPEVLFVEDNAGGVGGAVGGLISRGVGIGGGGLKFKEAETSIVISATRSGVQVAAAEGKGKATDFGVGAFAFLGGVGGAVGGYKNTNEGKVVMKSFLDNYNTIVESVRDNPTLPPLSPEEVRAKVTGAPQAGGGFAEGDVIGAKIDNVELYADPSGDAEVVTRVSASDDLVYLGTEENGFLQVQSSAGAGWIRKVLAERR